MTEEKRFSYESLQDVGTIVKYLQSLIDGFEKGSITLKSDEGALTLHPKEMINFGVRAKKKNEKTKLTLKISWKESGNADNSLSIKV
jgi:amphi-Trp domain-containing protein